MLPKHPLLFSLVVASSCSLGPYDPSGFAVMPVPREGDVCPTDLDCGPGAVCIGYDQGRDRRCARACEPSSNTCGAGDSCITASDGSGFCHPSSAGSASTGQSCARSSDCATHLCGAWPGGYCTKSCSAQSDCSATAVCVNDAISGTAACLARCAAPGTQSTCRSGYTCIGLVGETHGVCAPSEESPEEGGGAGGGAAGSRGGDGSGGGGGSKAARCRTYATSFTETLTVPGAPTKTVAHSAVFDRDARTLTDTSSEATVVQTFASLADFIDMADPAVLLKRGGPTTIRTSNAMTTILVTHSFDAQRRLTGAVTRVSSAGTSFEMQRATYTAWDSYGRFTRGTLDGQTPIPTEKCIGQRLTQTYDDASRTLVSELSGGTSQSAYGNDTCIPHKHTTVFDANLIVRSVAHENPLKPASAQNTVHATATVCL